MVILDLIFFFVFLGYLFFNDVIIFVYCICVSGCSYIGSVGIMLG